MASERLQIILQMITGQYVTGAKQAATATRQITEGAEKAGGAFGKMDSAFGGLGKTIAGFVAGGAVLHFANDAIRAASDLGESINAVNKVFGSASDTITAFGKNASQVAGLSAREFNQLATGTGALLTNFGFTVEDAAEQTIRLGQRAADMASVFNTDVGSALNAINASLRGEQEPIRRFGVSLSDAAVRAKAVELGLAETTREVDAHGKAVASLELIYEQTNSAAGDFLQTSGDLANAQRIAAAELENTKAALGEALVAPKASLFGFATDAILSLRTLFGDETAEGMLRVREGTQALVDTLKEGGDGFTALANSALHVARSGELTRGVIIGWGAAAGIMGDDLDALGTAIVDWMIAGGEQRDLVLEVAEAFGILDETTSRTDLPELDPNPYMLTGEAVTNIARGVLEWMDSQGMLNEHLGRSVALAFDVDEAVGLFISNAKQAVGPFGDLNDELLSAARAGRDLASALLEIASPAFRAAQAQGRLRTAAKDLEGVQKDSKASAEDVAQAQLDYAEAVLEADAANASFASDGITNELDAIATALNEDREFVIELLDILGVLDGMEVRYTITGTVSEQFVDPAAMFTLDDQRAIANERAAASGYWPTPAVPLTPAQLSMLSEGGIIPQTVNNNTEITINNPTTQSLESDLQLAGLLASVKGLVE